jgi:phosphatidylethanolamine N-methyltransferase
MSEKQAKRIVSLIQAAFEVDMSMDVVVAEPNVGALTRRILGARSLKGA